MLTGCGSVLLLGGFDGCGGAVVPVVGAGEGVCVEGHGERSVVVVGGPVLAWCAGADVEVCGFVRVPPDGDVDGGR